MDFVMLYRIIECLRKGEPMDQNVYAVSYTHLDVYKRQQQTDANALCRCILHCRPIFGRQLMRSVEQGSINV